MQAPARLDANKTNGRRHLLMIMPLNLRSYLRAKTKLKLILLVASASAYEDALMLAFIYGLLFQHRASRRDQGEQYATIN